MEGYICDSSIIMVVMERSMCRGRVRKWASPNLFGMVHSGRGPKWVGSLQSIFIRVTYFQAQPPGCKPKWVKRAKILKMLSSRVNHELNYDDYTYL